MTSEFNFPKDAFGYIPGAVPAKMVYAQTQPSNPVEGLWWVQTAVSGAVENIYFYTGSQWLFFGMGSGSVVSETQPVNPREGMRWFNPSVPAIYVYYYDGDSGQWIEEMTQGVDGALRSDLGVLPSDVGIHIKQSRRNISHYISKAQLEDALTGNPTMDTTAGWNDALQDTSITALDFKGGYKVSGSGAACITQTANVSLYGNSRRDTFIRADSAGANTNILNLRIADNGGLGDVRGWEAHNFNMFHNGGGASCIVNDAGLPMLECSIKNLGLQAGFTAGSRDLIMTRLAFSVVERCTFGSGVTCGTAEHQSPDGNKFLYNNFSGIPTSLILDIESGAYRTEVYGGTMVSRDGGVRIIKGSQVAIRGVQFEQFLPYGVSQSPEKAHIAILGSAGQISEGILIEANNFGGGTNLDYLVWVGYGTDVDITKNFMNAPAIADVYTSTNAKYTKPRRDNMVRGNTSNPRDQTSRFPMVVADNGVGTYNVLKSQVNLQNGWLGGQFFKNENDEVVINTGFNAGSIAPNTVICVMPEGFRPADFYTLPAVSDAGFCVVAIQPNGTMQVKANTSGSNSSFASNLKFSVRRGA